MKRVAGLLSVLLLGGCAAPAGVAAPNPPAPPAPAAPSTVRVRPESLLKLPLGTVVDFDAVTVAALADEGAATVEGKPMWSVRVRGCVALNYVPTKFSPVRWYASVGAGQQVEAEDIAAGKPFGGVAVMPGDCAEGLVYFPMTSRPNQVWYSSGIGAAGMVGWIV